MGAERGQSGSTGIVRVVCLEEVVWAGLGRGYSKLHLGCVDISSSYFSGFGCLLPLGFYLNLAITFPREVDLPFPGIKTLGNLDPSHPGPRLPVGFAVGSQ